MKTGIDLIVEERQRQLEKEGWTHDHDKEHVNRELIRAAEVYMQGNTVWRAEQLEKGNLCMPPPEWPWEKEWYKPSTDPIRNLVKAGALIAAEIDRLQMSKNA